MNHQAGAGGGLALERAANRLQPFAHATQTVALRTIGATPVIDDLQRAKLLLTCEPHTAGLRLGVAYHVSHGFTKRQGKNGLLCRAERNVGGFAVHGDARRFQCLASAEKFGRRAPAHDIR